MRGIRRTTDGPSGDGGRARGRRRPFWRGSLTTTALVVGVVLGVGGIAAGVFATSGSGTAASLAETLAAPTGLALGTQLTGTPGTTGTTGADVPLVWTPSADPAPTGYMVYRCAGDGCTPTTADPVTAGGCASSVAHPLTAAGCNDTDPALEPDAIYEYAVAAVYDAWQSPDSLPLMVVTPEPATPADEGTAGSGDGPTGTGGATSGTGNGTTSGTGNGQTPPRTVNAHSPGTGSGRKTPPGTGDGNQGSGGTKTPPSTSGNHPPTTPGDGASPGQGTPSTPPVATGSGEGTTPGRTPATTVPTGGWGSGQGGGGHHHCHRPGEPATTSCGD